jgi:manganese/zinc/iron transport system permease protein
MTAIFLQYDLPSLLLGVLAALSCAIIGNFLLLRRQSLMGDTISHVVLPGIVGGYLLVGAMSTWAMMGGAGVAAIASVLLIALVRHLARVEGGAAMGLVFTTMFALGVVMLEQSGARAVHLDVEHALYGNLESAVWLDAEGWGDLLSPKKLAALPAAVWRLAGVTALVFGLVILFYKELKLASFDPAFADNLGFSSRAIDLALIVLTAVAAVAAFEAVGSILVIAMFVCPAAAARMLTDILARQIWLSAAFALVSGILGYGVAAFGPIMLGYTASLSAAGMIAVVAGLIQLITMLLAPRYGALAVRGSRPTPARRRRLSAPAHRR